MRRVQRGEVEDAVSEVFIVTWRKIENLPPDSEVLPWLYGIARNVVRNVNRSSRRRSNLNVKMGSLPRKHTDSAEVQVVRNQNDDDLLRAVAQLSPIERDLLRLRTWEELPLADIAAIVGKSVRSVESKLGRTRKKLERSLATSDVTTHPTEPLYVDEGGEA